MTPADREAIERLIELRVLRYSRDHQQAISEATEALWQRISDRLEPFEDMRSQLVELDAKLARVLAAETDRTVIQSRMSESLTEATLALRVQQEIDRRAEKARAVAISDHDLVERTLDGKARRAKVWAKAISIVLGALGAFAGASIWSQCLGPNRAPHP